MICIIIHNHLRTFYTNWSTTGPSSIRVAISILITIQVITTVTIVINISVVTTIH